MDCDYPWKISVLVEPWVGLEPLNCVLIVPMAIPVLCHYLLVLMEAAGADVLVARRVALCFDCALLALYMRNRDIVEAVDSAVWIDAGVELEFGSLDQKIFVLVVTFLVFLVCLVMRRNEATQGMATQLVA